MKVLADHIKGSETAVIMGGMVPMVDQMSKKFARMVKRFLDQP